MGNFWAQLANWGLLDDASILTGILYAIIKHFATSPRLAFFTGRTGKLAAHGMSLLPLSLLLVASLAGRFSGSIVAYLVTNNRVVLGLSAVLAIFTILGDE